VKGILIDSICRFGGIKSKSVPVPIRNIQTWMDFSSCLEETQWPEVEDFLGRSLPKGKIPRELFIWIFGWSYFRTGVEGAT
jgi:hypothetical protein